MATSGDGRRASRKRSTELEPEVASRALEDAIELGSRDVADLLGRRLAERLPEYELEQLVGRGGMGAVYRARHKRLRRDVAIKALLPPREGIDPLAWLRRFEREAIALSRLRHPHVVTLFDFGGDDELAWIVMEFVEGANLREVLEEGGLEQAEALDIARQLADALQAAHDEGIVHRDVKPENVLVDERGHVVLVDLGVAKLDTRDGRRSSALTKTGVALGSASYVAPEAIEEPTRTDHRADVFGLGVLLYEMLTGRMPIGNFPPPSELGGSDPALDDVILRALDPDPESRIQDVRTLKRELGLDQTAGSGAPVIRRLYPLDVQRSWLSVIACAVGLSSLNLDWVDSGVNSARSVVGWDAGHGLLALMGFSLPVVFRVLGPAGQRWEGKVDLAAAVVTGLAPFLPLLVSPDDTLLRGSWLAVGCSLALLVSGALAHASNESANRDLRARPPRLQ